jgi:hypothetical protein
MAAMGAELFTLVRALLLRKPRSGCREGRTPLIRLLSDDHSGRPNTSSGSKRPRTG